MENPLTLSASCVQALARFERVPAQVGVPAKEVLFLSLSNGHARARTLTGRGDDLQSAWQAAWAGCPDDGAISQWIRVDRVTCVYAASWGQLRKLLAGTKTNYFSLGIAWDADLAQAFLPEELWGHACLYSGDINACVPHEGNLRALSKNKFGQEMGWPVQDTTTVWLFQTKGIFVQGDGEVLVLDAAGAMDRIRPVDLKATPLARQSVADSGDFLSDQVQASGRWVYGMYPCFDRIVPSYNTLRHASAAYALLEAWDVSRKPAQLGAATRAIAYLCAELIQPVSVGPGERVASYLVDGGAEIKLGGNGVAIIALAKRFELTGEALHLDLIRPLAEGLLRMQDPKTGGFVHVLQYPSLELKEVHRTVYYDGEALLGLLKAYELTDERRYLDAAIRAVEHFIEAEHWRSHDHWLAYGLNELTRYCPEPRYFLLGLRNVHRHMPFIEHRITAYPTLLELMMATCAMLDRMEALGLDPVALEPSFDRQAFDRVLHQRARYAYSGFLFPELAMFFRSPQKICNTFFIRHYSFRVRIDDVQHFISGLAAYHKRFLRRTLDHGMLRRPNTATI